MSIRVLIVDDQLLIRRALKLLLADVAEIAIVGDAENGEAAIAQVTALQPDVVLMDILMPICDGVEATRKICQQYPHIKVLILSIDDDDDYVAQALRYGAVGYLQKNTPPEDLTLAIQSVSRGYTYLGRSVESRYKTLHLRVRESYKRFWKQIVAPMDERTATAEF
ncbi:response regulator [Trichothermofontia sp.]